MKEQTVERIELTHKLIRLIESNHASTFFLNGPPGAGKSHLLRTFAEHLPAEIQRSFVLGPYQIAERNSFELSKWVIRDCLEAGFVIREPPLDGQWDLVKTWQWLIENANLPAKQTFLVLVDLGITVPKDLADISTLFSNVRYLEGVWDSSKLRIHHLFAGHWDHPAMESYFDGINTSFPYTVGYNYFVWHGVSPDDMIAMTNEYIAQDTRIPFGNILYELTGGHPGAASDIIKLISAGEFSFSSLLSATRQAALEGGMSQELLLLWSQLPMESRSIIKEMILQRRLLATTLSPQMERLNIAGIIRKNQIGKHGYIDFRSWYVELIILLHLDQLGIADESTRKVDFEELTPRTSTVCIEAFRLINEIENLTRNFVSVHLCLQSEPGFHYLMRRARKYNPEKRAEEDAYERAEDWQNRSSDRGLPVELNPLIAYLSIRDLANLIEELGAEKRSPEWLRIAQAIRTLSDVRDAVMHNQLIDDQDLHQLYDLQADIYEALSK